MRGLRGCVLRRGAVAVHRFLGPTVAATRRWAGAAAPSTATAFHTAADATIDRVMAAVEGATEAAGEKLDDVEMSDGVLTVQTASGTFVLNKQAPKLQLWLSSPVSGPHHYDADPPFSDAAAPGGAVAWKSDRDGHRLDRRLADELSSVLGTPVEC